MGTALASFVAGALIVLTLFDETQVTKVDGLQGNIRELRTMVQSWNGNASVVDSPTIQLEDTRQQLSDAIDESQKYLIYLEKEQVKSKTKTISKWHSIKTSEK